MSGIDPAQLSRTIPIAYQVTEKTFFEQLQAQKTDDDMKNFWIKHNELAKPKQVKVEHVAAANCSRFKMLFTHVYEYLKYDDLNLNNVATSMFGPSFLPQLQSWKRAEQPIPPEEIMDHWDAKLEKRVREMSKENKDVTVVTVHRLAYHMNDKDITPTDKQMNNVLQLMGTLDKDTAFMLAKLLMENGTPKRNDYSRRISTLSKALPPDQQISKQIIELRNNINEKLGLGKK